MWVRAAGTWFARTTLAGGTRGNSSAAGPALNLAACPVLVLLQEPPCWAKVMEDFNGLLHTWCLDHGSVGQLNTQDRASASTWPSGLKNALPAGLMNFRGRNRKARRQVLFESCQSAQARRCPLRAGVTTKTSARRSDSRYSVGYFISFTLPKATVTGVHETKGRYNPLDAKQHSASGCGAGGPAHPG